jgi:hypothetical protein
MLYSIRHMVFGAVVSGISNVLGTAMDAMSIGMDSAYLAQSGNMETVDDVVQMRNENTDASGLQQRYVDATTGNTSRTGSLLPGITSTSSSSSSLSSVCAILVLLILLM